MLTTEPPAIYLKRRCLAKDYFQQIPDERVGLNGWVRGTEAQCAQHAASVGLDALTCDTVACLAGWLWTLPEYREWVRAQPEGYVESCRLLQRFLGIDRRQRDSSSVFWPRNVRYDGADASNPAISDKTLALRRLDRLIAEAATTGMI